MLKQKSCEVFMLSMLRTLIMLSIIIPTISLGYNIKGKSQKIFIVGVEQTNKEPISYINSDGDYQGIYREFLDKFAKDHNYHFIYKPMKLNNLFTSLYDRTIDFKFPDNPVWRSADKRAHRILYTHKIHFYLEGLYVKPENIDRTIDSINSVGLITDVVLWSLHHYLEVNSIKIRRANNCLALVQQVLVGELDAMVCEHFLVKYALKTLEMPQDSLVFNVNLPFVDDYYSLSTIMHQDVIEQFNIWFAKNTNFLKTLYSKHGFYD